MQNASGTPEHVTVVVRGRAWLALGARQRERLCQIPFPQSWKLMEVVRPVHFCDCCKKVSLGKLGQARHTLWRQRAARRRGLLAWLGRDWRSGTFLLDLASLYRSLVHFAWMLGCYFFAN